MIGLVRLGAEAWALRPWRLPRPETDTTEAPFARPRKRTSGPEPRVRTQTSWPGARPATCQQRRGRRGAGRGGPGEGPRAGAYSPASAHIGLDGFVRCATTGPVFPKGPTREALPRVEPGGKFTPRGNHWGVQVRFVHVDAAAYQGLLLHVGAQGLRGDLWTTLPCAARREATSWRGRVEGHSAVRSASRVAAPRWPPGSNRHLVAR